MGKFDVSVGPPIGIAGTEINAGILGKEYNRRLQGNLKWDVYKQVENDAHVEEARDAAILPILNADFYIERFSDTPQAREMQDFCEMQMFERGDEAFTTTLDWVADYIFNGFSMAEQEFTTLEWPGRSTPVYGWEALHYRAPSTVFKWNFAKGNKLESIQQQAIWGGDETSELADTMPVIPASNLIVFTRKRRGRDWEGEGKYRKMYRHFRYIDLREKADSIYADRMGAGFFVVRYPAGADEKEISKFEQMARDTRSNARGYLLIPDDFELEYQHGATKGQINLMPGMRYHQEMIAKCVLGSFLNYGTTGTGSRALGESAIDFFRFAENAYVRYITGEITQQGLKRLQGKNWDITDGYCRLRHKTIEARDVQKIGAFLKIAADAGYDMGKDDPLIVNQARKEIDWPELGDDTEKLMTEERVQDMKERKQKLKDRKAGKVEGEGFNCECLSCGHTMKSDAHCIETKCPECGSEMRRAERPGNLNPPSSPPGQPPVTTKLPREKPQPAVKPGQAVPKIDAAEIIGLDFAEIQELGRDVIGQSLQPDEKRRTPARAFKDIETLLGGEVWFNEIENRMRAIFRRMGLKGINFFSSYIDMIIKAAAQGKDPLKFRPAGLDETVDSLKLEIEESYEVGGKDYVGEYNKTHGKQEQFSDFAEEDIPKQSKAKAVAAGAKEVRRRLVIGTREIQNQALLSMGRITDAGLTGNEALRRLTNDMAALSDAKLRNLVNQTAKSVYGKGRQAEAYRLSPYREVYSAIFDGNICDRCAPFDGVVHRVGDPTYQTPNPNCEGRLGGNDCRCISIPVPSDVRPGPDAAGEALKAVPA